MKDIKNFIKFIVLCICSTAIEIVLPVYKAWKEIEDPALNGEMKNII